MRPFARFTFALAAISTPLIANAQEVKYESLLVPVSLVGRVPGAFGSLWETELCVAAVGGDVRFATPHVFNTPTVIPANTTRCTQGSSLPGWPSGEFLLLDASTSANAVLNLRIRDVSRDAQSWGTELPIVRSSDLHIGTLFLTNVPLDDRFRTALRVYLSGDDDASFTIRIFDLSGRLIVQRTEVAKRGLDFGAGYAYFASSVEITSLAAAFPELPNATRVLISVTPEDASRYFWAFVSVANNETQQITTITPQ